MALVVFEAPEFAQEFEFLEEGTYFKYQNDLCIKIFLHADDDGYESNAYNFSKEEFDYFTDSDLVTPISESRIKIEVRRTE